MPGSLPFSDLAEAISVGMGPAWHAALTPDKSAVILGDETLTYQSLNDSCNQLANAMRSAGLQSGDTMAIVSRNRLEFVISYFAGQRIGLRITAINWHLTTAEIEYILSDCAAQILMLDADLDVLAAALVKDDRKMKCRISLGGDLADFHDFASFCSGQDTQNISEPRQGQQMLYTSGTTGRPKGVIRKPRGARPNARRHYLPDHARVLCTGPLYHAAPLSQNLVQPLQQGKTVVIMPRFEPEETLRLIDAHTITHSHMVSTMFHRMLALPEGIRSQYDLSSIETIWHGAAPTPIHVKRAMIDWLGEKLDEYYAATETGGTEITAAEWLQKPGSVGLPEKGQEIIILDEYGNTQPAGEVGTIYFNGALSGGFSYHGDEKKTQSVFRGDLYTLGDHGYLDHDGYLFLTGRSAEVIISGGVNIYPVEVDAVLLMHPSISDAAVVGVPNDEFGEEVKAVIELKPLVEMSATLSEDIILFCRKSLAHYKCPRSVDFVNRLPRSDAGKVFRKRVRDQYWTD